MLQMKVIVLKMKEVLVVRKTMMIGRVMNKMASGDLSGTVVTVFLT